MTTPNEELRARHVKVLGDFASAYDASSENGQALRAAIAALAPAQEPAGGGEVDWMRSQLKALAKQASDDDMREKLHGLAAAITNPSRPYLATPTPQAAGVSEDFPPLPKCWTGSPVTVTWAEDGEATTREVYTAEQMYAFVIADREARTVSGQQDARVSLQAASEAPIAGAHCQACGRAFLYPKGCGCPAPTMIQSPTTRAPIATGAAPQAAGDDAETKVLLVLQRRFGSFAHVTREDARAALTAAGAAPEEWVLVPREPTEAMVNAARRFSVPGYCIAAGQWPAVYRAMLAAAPQPGAQHGQEGRE